MTKYRVWTGDGSIYDGSEYDTQDDAILAVCDRYGWDSESCEIREHCDGSAVSVYETERDANADLDGAYAATVSEIE